jgi:acyl carrier protein
MNEKLSIILQQSLGIIENYSTESNLKDFSNWDSMNHMILITQIESEFDIQFTGDEIADLKTVGCILNLVNNKS